jgi:purine-cytosine permease-like protein
MLAMMLGWFGVNVGVAGVALGRLVGVPDVAGVVLFAAIMLAVTGFGIGTLSWSALVAGLATTGLAAYGLHLAFDDRPLTLAGGEAGSDPIGFVPALALVVGYGAAFSLRTPDFTHDLERPRQVVWCALTGLAIPVLAFGLAGAALHAATGTWDLADVMRDLGSPEVAYLFVALGFTGSVLTNIWSGALSLQDAAPRMPHRAALLAVAAAGAVLAGGGFDDLMLSWLTAMALAAPGLAAVCVIHAARGGTADDGWRAAGLAAWGGGFACGMALHLAGSGLALPAATLVPALVYWLSRGTGERDLVDARQGG